MPIYEVGKPYNPNVTRWEELPEYNFRSGQHELLLFFRAPTGAEIESVKTGAARFAFTVEHDVIFLLYEFKPGVNWGDAAFQIHLVKPDERKLPEPEATETRALLSVMLIDADTGILRAMRAITFSPEFTRALHEAIRQQAAAPFDPDTHRARVQRIYARLDTNDLRRRAVATCKGGK